MKKIVALIAALLLAPAALAASPAKAPGWILKTPEGATVKFPADARGKPTVLMFWPSWCPFSRALQPYVNDIWKDYKDHGVNVWTLNIKEDKDPVQVMKERGLSFPVLLNADDVALRYGLEYTPWLVVIDGQNNIVYTRPPKPPTPIDTAKEVRAKLNELLGPGKGVALPESYPKPYDLHLKDPATLNQRLEPRKIAEKEWGPWLDRYLAGIPEAESVKDFPARGEIANGKAAIALARELWTKKFGEDAAHDAAPYNAYRKDTRWVVVGNGLDGKLGSGLIAVFDAATGRVIRLQQGGAE